jgi:hypothetical protein
MSFSMQGKVEFWPNCCPRCDTGKQSGDVYMDKDEAGWFLQCITCGWMVDAYVGRDPRGAQSLRNLILPFEIIAWAQHPRKNHKGYRRRVYAADSEIPTK